MSPAAWKALGALLVYPTQELRLTLPAIAEILAAQSEISTETRRALGRLIERLGAEDPLDLEEAYVGLFDRHASLSLHLFEHVHGDSRERGPAMLELRGVYERAGFEPITEELPDYLPLLCEFASLAPADRGRELLADAAPVLAALGCRLEQRGSSYAAVLAALLELCGAAGWERSGEARGEVGEDDGTAGGEARGGAGEDDGTARIALGAGVEGGNAAAGASARGAGVERARVAPGDDLAELDRRWEEPPVTFGPGDLGLDCAGPRAASRGGGR